MTSRFAARADKMSKLSLVIAALASVGSGLKRSGRKELHEVLENVAGLIAFFVYPSVSTAITFTFSRTLGSTVPSPDAHSDTSPDAGAVPRLSKRRGTGTHSRSTSSHV